MIFILMRMKLLGRINTLNQQYAMYKIIRDLIPMDVFISVPFEDK